VLQATGDYRTEQDLLLDFIEERTEQHPEYSEAKKTMYEAFKSYVDGDKELAVKSRRWLSSQIESRGFSTDRYHYFGLRLK
jgi:phage/plasmid-associated DNA primase